jgi:hypothetical protein
MWLGNSWNGVQQVEANLQMWEATLPALDGVAQLGGTWQPNHGEYGDPIELRPPQCTVFERLQVPIAPNNAQRVIALFRDLRPRWAFDHNVAALMNTVAELRRVAPPDSPRWVIMTDSGLASCIHEARGTRDDPNNAAPFFAEALRQGVKVMMIGNFEVNGVRPLTSDQLVGSNVDAVELWSVAGGALRRDGPRGLHFWLWPETDAIREAIRENITRPYHCRQRTDVPESDRVGLSLSTGDGAVIRQGAGWRFSAEDSRFVEVLGPDCDALVRSQAPLRLISSQRLCFQ